VNIVNVIKANGDEFGAADERRPDCDERWPLKNNGDNRKYPGFHATRRTTFPLISLRAVQMRA
jgi:hypothetical protein